MTKRNSKKASGPVSLASLPALDRHIATATIGVDTLWGGDVRNPSGTGRFIADCWFSDVELPEAYTNRFAAKLRKSGGVGAKEPDIRAIEGYIKEVDIPGAIHGIEGEAAKIRETLRKTYLFGLASSLQVMWDLAMEIIGKGDPVPYERCMLAATGDAPEPSNPARKRKQLMKLLRTQESGLADAVMAWRRPRLVPSKTIRALSDAFIAQYDALTVQNVLPHMPASLRNVPRANIEFLPIENAWFSGSMNYLGRARKPDGSPEYEATYEINASLEISIPEFQQLISHEVVPGHVTTSAYLQNLYVRGKLGFEASVQAMNTRSGTLAEGIANNGILMAYGVMDLEELPDPDMQIGMLLALLQDDAKNQSSFLTWQEKRPQQEVRDIIRRDYLLSQERAEKLSGPWGRHPLMGRMNLTAYRSGTELVAKLRRKLPPGKILPLLFGCDGIVDSVNIRNA